MINMQLPNPVLAPVIKYAALATLGGDLVGFYLGGWILKLNSNLFFFVAVLAWLPIVAVALRRPENPTRSDRLVMFGAFPALFVGVCVVRKLYL
jgi:hypothetical protein